MFNDFRNGITKYPVFYELVSAKHQSSDQLRNHVFLKKLIHFADARRGQHNNNGSNANANGDSNAILTTMS
jgi:hypothetical protein